ncbi:hypothetical protein UCD39_03265 [Nitrospirillum sp. BR 11752]|uniref:hypothetical protein n=1 Tax=Nitrospirillum sp. BR 11752 TaxID=3104293 RepID=UPI002EBEDCF5|nr:hypothetical protein [Nitrospirillum sp. BR 11752]
MSDIVEVATSVSGLLIMWIVMIIFNVAVLKLLTGSWGKIDVRDMVREKNPKLSLNTVPVIPNQDGQTSDKSTNTSYSRVSGLVGAIVLTCFFWAFGNVIIYKFFVHPTDIEVGVKGAAGFLLAGSALFAPYAFNQLSSAFK